MSSSRATEPDDDFWRQPRLIRRHQQAKLHGVVVAVIRSFRYCDGPSLASNGISFQLRLDHLHHYIEVLLAMNKCASGHTLQPW